MMKKIISCFNNKILLATAVLLLLLSSCAKEFPKNQDSADEVMLKSIKIVNAGAAGNGVIEGVINENTKTISFPRLDTLTDFSKIKFEATMSNGATLDKPTYKFDFKENNTNPYYVTGKSSLTQIVKVVNNKRYREYAVTLRLYIPVFGADFTKPQIFDNSNNPLGNPVYPAFTGGLTRGSDFDGNNVLIVTRAAGGSHLLKVSDLEKNVIAPAYLNLTGIAGGTFAVNVGAHRFGHTYIANLSGNSAANPIKIYHWTDPALPPQIIFNQAVTGAGVRLGDNMSANLDENGNGYFFFGDNAATVVLRLKVTNFTTISEPTTFASATGSTFSMSYNKIWNSDEYIYTGYEAPIRLANDAGVISYTLGSTTVPVKGSDAHVINFNKERYLIMTTAARTGSDAATLLVYDITRGSTTKEALQLFDARDDKSPLYQYSLLAAVNTNSFTQTRWAITKDAQGNDDKLLLYTAFTDAGFAIIEFPKKVLD